MRKEAVVLFLLGTLFLLTGAPSKPAWGTREIWTEHERGWFWYESFRGLSREQKRKPGRIPQHTVKREPSTKPRRVSYRELLEEVRRELEEIRARALLDPTPENVAAWYAAQIIAIRMAGDFTQASLLVPILYPELDLSSVLPGSEWGSQVLAYSNLKQKSEALSELALKGALVIFYRSPGCFLCEREMEALRALKKLYGFKIYALYEGEPPGGADRAKPVTPRLLEKLDVKTFPTLYYFRDGRFHFLGMGALGTSETERRLLLLARSQGWTSQEPLYALDRLPLWKNLGLDEGESLKKLLEVLKRLRKEGYRESTESFGR